MSNFLQIGFTLRNDKVFFKIDLEESSLTYYLTIFIVYYYALHAFSIHYHNAFKDVSTILDFRCNNIFCPCSS
jgi:hypothetical protein